MSFKATLEKFQGASAPSKPGASSTQTDLEAQWKKIAGMKSDLVVFVGDVMLNLHKYPLYSKTDYFPEVAEDGPNGKTLIKLNSLPGGVETFKLVANFCYGMELDITPKNVAALRCAASYLDMMDDSRTGIGRKGNLVSLTEKNLQAYLQNWEDAVVILKSCETLLPTADSVGILGRTVSVITEKAVKFHAVGAGPGIHVSEGVLDLRMDFYSRIIEGLRMHKMSDKEIARSLDEYSMRYLPDIKEIFDVSMGDSNSFLLNKMSLDDEPLDPDEANYTVDFFERQWKHLLESLVELYPATKNSVGMGSLLRLLRCAIFLNASKDCKYKLHKRAGEIFDQAKLEDLLLLEVQDVQGLLTGFTSEEHLASMEDPQKSIAAAAVLIDSYLKEAAGRDLGLSSSTFKVLGQALPDEARPSHDLLYNALEIFVEQSKKAPPFISDRELLSLCELIDPARLSPEVQDRAVANESLPLEFISDVLHMQKQALKDKADIVEDGYKAAEKERDDAYRKLESMRGEIEDLKRRISSAKVTFSAMEAALKEDHKALQSELEVARAHTVDLHKRISLMREENASLKRARSSRSSRKP